ncbi:MAG: hypothetical protein FWD23_13255 [Oscillospiraceae bacterium]|nr:hypothetical protein [Oscillospiraceae bacterium]
MNENNKSDLANSRALFVLRIVTMSFAILACVVVATAMLTRWILDLNMKVKESNTKMAKAAARIDKFRKSRIKHILSQRKQQLKEEKADKKKQLYERSKKLAGIENDGETAEDLDELEELDALGNLSDEDFENQV